MRLPFSHATGGTVRTDAPHAQTSDAEHLPVRVHRRGSKEPASYVVRDASGETLVVSTQVLRLSKRVLKCQTPKQFKVFDVFPPWTKVLMFLLKNTRKKGLAESTFGVHGVLPPKTSKQCFVTCLKTEL